MKACSAVLDCRSYWPQRRVRHHGWVNTTQQSLTLNGTIEESGYSIPMVSCASRQRTDLDRRLAPPSRMENRGLTGTC